MFEYLLSNLGAIIVMVVLVLVGVAIGIALYGVRKRNQRNSQ